MRLLVTGGAGFIGTNFVRYTRAHRPDVQLTVFDALTYAATEAVPDGVRLLRGDVTDADAVDAAVRDTDLVLHLAAESHNDRALRDPGPFVRTNLLGTYTLLEAVRRRAVRLHHVSTDEVYGELTTPDAEPFVIDSPYRPSNPYSASKAGADHLVRAWTRCFGMDATISICSNNYGPYQHVEKFVARQITNVLTGRRPRLFGSGEQVRDWLHVDDHCAGLWAVIERGRSGRDYLFGAGRGHSNRAVLAVILELMDRPADWFDLVADRPGHDARYALDPTRARVELGWEPERAELRAGLAETIAWYAEHRKWWAPVKAAVEEGYAERAQ